MLPLGETGVGRHDPCAVDVADPAEVDPKRCRDDARMAHRHDGASVVLVCESTHRTGHPEVEAVPAVAVRSERPVGFGEHVERAETARVVGPVNTVRVAGVDLTQRAVAFDELESERWSDDLGGLDGSRDLAGDEMVDVDASRRREMFAEQRRLSTAEVREPGAAGWPGDRAVEPGVSIAVSDEDELQDSVPSCAVRAVSRYVAALTSARCVKACGRLPMRRPLGLISSENTPVWLAYDRSRSKFSRA